MSAVSIGGGIERQLPLSKNCDLAVLLMGIGYHNRNVSYQIIASHADTSEYN